MRTQTGWMWGALAVLSSATLLGSGTCDVAFDVPNRLNLIVSDPGSCCYDGGIYEVGYYEEYYYDDYYYDEFYYDDGYFYP